MYWVPTGGLSVMFDLTSVKPVDVHALRALIGSDAHHRQCRHAVGCAGQTRVGSSFQRLQQRCVKKVEKHELARELRSM